MVDPQLAFLGGPSGMAKLMREHDWSQSPLGLPQRWPQSLRSGVNLMMGSGFPMFVAWGPQLVQLYNDAYAPIMGVKHPAGLGRPVLETWAEVRAEVEPLMQQALRGESPYFENLPLRPERGPAGAEDTWFTFSYSPILDESGAIAGVFCACIETTKSVVSEQQMLRKEEWLQVLFDQAPGFAAVLRGPEHVFTQANAAYRQLTGNIELIGKSVAQALPQAVEQGFVGWLDGVYATGTPFVGRSVPVSVSHGPGEPAYQALHRLHVPAAARVRRQG